MTYFMVQTMARFSDFVFCLLASNAYSAAYLLAQDEGVADVVVASPWTVGLDFAERFGVLALLVVFLLWRDWTKGKRDDQKEETRNKEHTEREKLLVERVESLELFQRETLVSLLTNQSAVLAQNSQVMQEFAKNQERHIEALDKIGKA